ncbi:MAG: tryptophan-rich sensory protein, partial [Alphaproteobacteria bacterium]|nr:tryptophan-rich sensory protein [Alphaproteobacteria bacterium]
AIAAVTSWRAAATDKVSDTIVGLFAFNGFLNLLWSLLFFRMERPDWAFIEVIALWLSILALAIYCGRQSRLAGVLLLPYLVWVTIAAALNWRIVQLNAPFG